MKQTCAWLMIFLLLMGWLVPVHAEAPAALGLFLGVDDPTAEQLAAMGRFSAIAVDMDTLSDQQISTLKEGGVTLYAYLSIGSLENYRPWYETFRTHTLHPYENWPDEAWMDVTYGPWRAHLVTYARDTLLAMGADELFLDNGDVYDQDHREETYDALLTILQSLHGLGKPMILNGGDVLLSRMLEEGGPLPLSGAHQESVFSTIVDYEKNAFATQSPADTAYNLAYLTRCQAAGLACYMTEYTRDEALIQRARQEAADRGFGIFITDDVGLRGAGA